MSRSSRTQLAWVLASLLVIAGCQEVMGRLAPPPTTTTVETVGLRQAIDADAGRSDAGRDSQLHATRLQIRATRVRVTDPKPTPNPPPSLLVRFRFGEYCLGSPIAEQVRGWSQQFPPGTEVTVDGHTDSRGTSAYNDRLSRDRVATVARLLDRLMVDTHAFGESRPVAANKVDGQDNPKGRMRNRRVEVRLVETVEGTSDDLGTDRFEVLGPALC